MPKRRLSLTIPLPPYRHPRNDWRRLIHAEARTAQLARRVQYRPSDKLELVVVLGLSPGAALIHDVDNRLKDVLDALQGRAGGSKASHDLVPVIPNDRQIYKVSVEKSARTDRKRPRGRVILRKLQRARSRRGDG